MTSVRTKFRRSTIDNKEGVLYFQLIHCRKVKLWSNVIKARVVKISLSGLFIKSPFLPEN